MDLLNDFKEINEDFVNAAAPRIVEGVLRLKQFVNKYKQNKYFFLYLYYIHENTHKKYKYISNLFSIYIA